MEKLPAYEYEGLQNDYIILESTPDKDIPQKIKKDVISYTQFEFITSLELALQFGDEVFTESKFNNMIIDYVNFSQGQDLGELRRLEISLRVIRNIRHLFNIIPDPIIPNPIKYDRKGGRLV
jgi:hypothetical protein|tara:strand:+ start:1215 stop:1580 length:366 start_codon:yes stop_codon:yes gene_type:complete